MYMLRTHTEEAACVTHGGVIMNMLSHARPLPFRKPEEWMTDPGGLQRAPGCRDVDAGSSGRGV